MMDMMNNRDYYDSLALHNILKELNTYTLAQLRTIHLNIKREILLDKVERTKPYAELREEVFGKVRQAIDILVIEEEGEEV